MDRMKGFDSGKEPKMEPVKVLDSKKETKEETGEGSWLWLSLEKNYHNLYEVLWSSIGGGLKHSTTIVDTYKKIW